MASPVTLQLGAWSWQNEYNGTTAFVAHPSNPNGTVLNLNDGSTFTLVDSGQGRGDGMDWGKVEPSLFTSQNSHTTSKRVPKRLRNDTREVKVKIFWGQGSSYTTWIAALHTLIATCEGITQEKPGCLQVQVTNSSTPLYLDVVAASAETPYSETLWAQLAEDGLAVTFTCQPFFRGGMQTLQNVSTNPGFEMGAGPGVVVFSDTFTNYNAYANQYDSLAMSDPPIRYYPLLEAVGSTTAADAMITGNNMTGISGVTFGGAGAIANDPETSASASGAGQAHAVMTGLSSGASNWSMTCWVNLPSTGHGTQTVMGAGDANVAHGCAQIEVTNTGTVIFTDQTASTAASAALSTSAWHMLGMTYDGTTIRGYIDGAAGNTVAATCAISAAGQATLFCAYNNGSYTQKFFGSLAKCAFYNTTLSGARMTQLWNTGNTALTTDTFRYPDTVIATQPVRYYRLDESSGTVAVDAMGNSNASYSNAPTLGVTGALTGDTDTAVTLASASSQRVIPPSTGLPTGNNSISFLLWLKITAAPGSNQYVFSYGSSALTSGQIIECFVDTTAHINLDFGGATLITSAAISTNAYHMISVTWNGTTLALKIDNGAQSTATPGALALPTSSNPCFFGARANGTAFLSGTLDEAAIWSVALTNTQLNTIYTAATNSPTSTPNTMVIPQNGRYLFGNNRTDSLFMGDGWTAINQWTVRFRWVTNLQANFYLHTGGIGTNGPQGQVGNTGSYLLVNLNGATLNLAEYEQANGTTTLANPAAVLTNGMQYWLQITQFPTVRGNLAPGNSLPQLQAILYADNGGVVGTKIATAGPIAVSFYSSQLAGPPQIAAGGAALGLGGNFTGVHTLSLFGPGGWTFSSTGTGAAVGFWEQQDQNSNLDSNFQPNDPNCYAGGVTTSYGAAGITFPPFGTCIASWINANTTSATTIKQTAVNTFTNHVWNLRAWVLSNNLPNATTISLAVNEYDANGNFTGAGSVTGAGSSVTGNQASYTQLVGTYTSSASNVRYFVLVITVNGTASATTYGAPPAVWIDNVQIWDNTLGATMPYCELFFNQSPAQLLVSGILGDVPTPVSLSLGTIANLGGQTNLTVIVGRRGTTTRAAVLVGPTYMQTGGAAAWTQTLDTAGYGGWFGSVTNVANGYAPLGLWTSSYEASLTVGGVSGLGIYELYTRTNEGQSTPNIGNVTVAPRVRLDNTPGLYAVGLAGSEITQWQGMSYAPFSAALTSYALVDVGQILIPPFPVGVLANYQGATYSVQAVWGDTTGGGSSAQSSWIAAIPKDGGIVAAATYAISTAAGNPFFVYNDGMTAHLGLPAPWTSSGGYAAVWGIAITGQGFFNQMNAPIQSAGGPGSTSSVTPVVNPTADSFLTLDPSLLPQSSGGVNQLVALVTDSIATVFPVYAQITYSPLYLYPK